MKLNISCSSFNQLAIENVDPSSFTYYGSIEGYDYHDPNSYCEISFSLDNGDNEKTLEYIKSNFKLSNSNADDFVKCVERPHYYKDRRMKFSIIFKNGSKGWTNPPSFNFE